MTTDTTTERTGWPAIGERLCWCGQLETPHVNDRLGHGYTPPSPSMRCGREGAYQMVRGVELVGTGWGSYTQRRVSWALPGNVYGIGRLIRSSLPGESEPRWVLDWADVTGWAECLPAAVARGWLEEYHHGPSTYGHVTPYLPW